MGMLASNTLAMWFNRRLGLASGLSNIGMAAAMGGFPALSLLLIQTYGWRWAYAILGLAVWLLLLPLLALVFRNRPEDVGQEPDGGPAPRAEPAVKEPESERKFTLKAALRTRSYWIAAAAMASWSMIGTGVHFHIVPIFLERGLTAADAAAMFSIHAAVVAAARLGGGLLADRVPANLLIAAATISHSAGIVILNQADPQWMPALFALVFALGSGLWMAVNETLWVRYYGRAHLGKIRGSVVTIGVGTSSLGPFAMGLAYDTFGSFSQILWAFAILVAPLALLGLLATPPRNSPSR
jgi:cyanate permease